MVADQRRRAARAGGRRAHALRDRHRAATKHPILRLYLDSSVFASTLLREPTTEVTERVAPGGSAVVTSAIAYAEVRAALAAARRDRRISRSRLRRSRADFDRRWDEVDAVEADDALVRAAGDAADLFALRAGDAIHLASAQLAGDVRVLTFDRTLARAAIQAGLPVVATE